MYFSFRLTQCRMVHCRPGMTKAHQSEESKGSNFHPLRFHEVLIQIVWILPGKIDKTWSGFLDDSGIKLSEFSHLMLFPLTLRVSRLTGSLFLIVIFTDFKCVFIATSTPVIVPWTCVPFFSSSVTVSCDNFIKNLKAPMNNK